MKSRAGFIAASAFALAMCSCVPQAELDRAQAEAAKARADAEAAKAEAEALRAKAEAEEKAKDEELKRKDTQEKALAEAMKRWNAAAGGVTVTPPNFGRVDFLWSDLDKFPHPTFKGGSAEAYGAFAEAYLLFLQGKGNYEYLAKNDLFTAELRYAFPNGQHSTWTFLKLAEQLSQPTGYGSHNEATRKAIKEYADKMKAPPKG